MVVSTPRTDIAVSIAGAESLSVRAADSRGPFINTHEQPPDPIDVQAAGTSSSAALFPLAQALLEVLETLPLGG
jgi:hypothetical protein